MKNYFWLLLFILCSCYKSKPLPDRDQDGRRIFYNPIDLWKSKSNEDHIIVIDTACLNGKMHALKDIQNNKLVYFHGYAPHEKELRRALDKMGISSSSSGSSCLRFARFSENCYEGEMMEELYRRYGEAFFDSIWNQSLEDHIKKFPNETFTENGVTTPLKSVYTSLLK